MGIALETRVWETTLTTGLGSFALEGAVTGHRTFTDACADGDAIYYVASRGSQWEEGLGTFRAGGTLERTLVLNSSEAGAKINFLIGVKDVMAVFPGDRAAMRQLLGVPSSYMTRAELKAARDGGYIGTHGDTVFADGLAYKWSALATTIPDLPGLIPAGEYDVRHFGAVADGATTKTDNQLAINRTIAARSATGGGVVNMSEGIFYISSYGSGLQGIIMKSNVWLKGAGPGRTIIQWCGQAGFPIAGNTISNFKMSGFTLRGGTDIVTPFSVTSHGIAMWGLTDYVYEDIEVTDTHSYGLAFESGTMTRGVYRNIAVKRAGADAFDFKNPNLDNRDIVFDTIMIEDFDMKGDGGKAGIDIRGNNITASNIHVRSAFTANSDGVRCRQSSIGGMYSALANITVVNTGVTKYGNGINMLNEGNQVTNFYVENLARGVLYNGAGSGDSMYSAAANGTARNCTIGYQFSGAADRFANLGAVGCGTSYQIAGSDITLSSGISQGATTRDFDITSAATDAMLNMCRIVGAASPSPISDLGARTIIANSPTLGNNSPRKLLLDGITPAVSPSYTINLTEKFNELEIHLDGISHDRGTNDQLRIEISSDAGSTWSTALVVSDLLANTVAYDGIIKIYKLQASSGNRPIHSTIGQGNANAYISVGTRSVTGAVNAVRLSWSTGNIDAGTLTVYGVR